MHVMKWVEVIESLEYQMFCSKSLFIQFTLESWGQKCYKDGGY